MISFGKLRSADWIVVDQALDAPTLERWGAHCRDLYARGHFRNAGIGAGKQLTQNQAIRADQTCWIDETTDINGEILDWLEHRRQELNAEHLLGLTSFEAHFAMYPQFAHYDCHVDNAHGSDRRVISMVLYLNQSWQAEWGGELVLDPNQHAVKILPVPGRAVFFLSAGLEHEVAATLEQRWSITAWFTR